MDATSLLLVLTPIVFPVVIKLGFDPIWFGVITVVMVEIGFMTPPIGLCTFVLRGVSDASLEEIFGSCYQFVAIWLLFVIMMTVFPSLALFLPRMM